MGSKPRGNSFIYLIILAAAVFLVYSFYSQQSPEMPQTPLSEVAVQVREGYVTSIRVEGDSLFVKFKNGEEITSHKESGSTASAQLLNLGVTEEELGSIEIEVVQPPDWMTLLSAGGSILLVVAMLVGGYMMLRQFQGANSQALAFGKSRARMYTGDQPSVTFEDVAGVDEAKDELREVVEFLKEPDKFVQLGARIPKGVLLMGAPGTGKTLLAKAVSGEAGVPFFSISGSEFVEMFVGVGASVTGDTPVLVSTEQGVRLVLIAEFVDQYYEGDAEGFLVPVGGVQTLGYEEKDSKFKGSPKRFFGRSAWKSVSAVYRHRVNEICEIHYLGGVIRTTGDHSIFVRTRDGLKVKAARELQPGDVLVNLPFKVRGQYSPVHGTPHTIRAHQFSPLQEPIMLNVWDDDPEAREKLAFALEQRGLKSQREIAEVIGVSQATVGHWQAGINVPRSLSRSYVKQELTERVPLSPELMRLFGYYTAEGRYGSGLEFVFGAHETNLHKDCIELMHQVFNAEPSLHSTTTNSLRIDYPAPLGRFFARYCGNGSHNKHVPGMLWDLPRDYFLAYLEGYSLGDGYITQEGKLSMTSVSHRLITELTWLCAMHGIKVGVRKMELEGGRVISNKPLPDGEAWNLIIGKTSNPFTETDNLGQGKKPYVREVVVKPYEGYVYDLCGCENEAFFGGEKPILLHNSRVRDLFDQAKRHSPCIIFLDEIDAVGRHRGAGLGGSHDEREQTLNQILVEMDGFDTDTQVIIVAATNRPDILDPALLRPGRFDRRVVLDRPDIKGREAILKIHVRGKPLGEDMDLRTLAKSTPGFVGADIENLVNEAAILAARRDKKVIEMPEFEDAIERVIAGPERKSRLISEEEKRITAYHEAGHALVAHVLPKCDPVHKVSIVARGMASGYTMSLPEEDRRIVSKARFRDDLAFALGGRAAEELVFGDVTTGAANDLERVTEVARAMVTRYGMSDKLGPMTFGQKEELVFLGKEIGEQRDYGEAVAQEIDEEVRKIVREAYERAKDVLTRHREQLGWIAERLIEIETLGADEFAALFEGILEKEPEAPESPSPVPRAKRPAARPIPKRRKPALDVSPAPAPA